MNRNFLVLAANTQTREALAGELTAKGLSVSRAADGDQAEKILRSVEVDVALVESHLAGTTVEDLRLRLQRVRPHCSVISLTAFDQVRNTAELLSFGKNDYLIGGQHLMELIRPAQLVAGEEGTEPSSGRGLEALIEVVDVLVGLIELDDRFFGGSSHQAMRLTRAVAEEMSDDPATIREVVIATLLRDLGKVSVPPEILAAQGRFTDEQRERMQEHVASSLRLFEHVDFPWKVLPIVRHHHERYDGKGYPDGLSGRAIPIGSRIVAVVDAYLALTSDRHHREAIDPERALEELIREAGRQFDPEVVEVFQRVLDKRMAKRVGSAKPSILVADSQDDVRKLIKMRLLNEGYEVREAQSLDKARKLIDTKPPGLVLADIDSDHAAAFELLRGLREHDELFQIPVAFLSQQNDRVLKIRALREGVDDYLQKTGEIEELVARVENIITRESLRREGEVRPARRGIQGDLDNLSLADIVQTLVMGMKTACVSLNSDEREGQIWFEHGAAKHATTEKLKGEEAFFEMVRWKTGEFVIEHGRLSEESSLEQDPMFLLMEGMRLMDESQESEAQAAS